MPALLRCQDVAKALDDYGKVYNKLCGLYERGKRALGAMDHDDYLAFRAGQLTLVNYWEVRHNQQLHKCVAGVHRACIRLLDLVLGKQLDQMLGAEDQYQRYAKDVMDFLSAEQALRAGVKRTRHLAGYTTASPGATT